MKNYVKFMLPILCVSCVTPSFQDDSFQNRAFKTSVAKSTQETKDDENDVSTNPKMTSLFIELLDEEYSYNSEDQKLFEAIAKRYPDAKSIDSAVLYMASLRFCLDGSQRNDSLGENDLYDTNEIADQKSKSQKSLEKISLSFGISFSNLLEVNEFLQTYKIHQLTLEALDRTTNAEKWSNELHQLVQMHAAQWDQLAIDKKNKKDNQLLEKVEEEKKEEEESKKLSPPLPYGYDQLSSGEETMKKAQSLIDQNMYKESIDLLSSIGMDDLYYSEAKEKIRDASNEAIKILRMRAAEDFQSFITVSDPKAKETYLNSAKERLETAINTYPNADQLDTVKQNLELIKKNLESISE